MLEYVYEPRKTLEICMEAVNQNRQAMEFIPPGEIRQAVIARFKDGAMMNMTSTTGTSPNLPAVLLNSDSENPGLINKYLSGGRRRTKRSRRKRTRRR